MHVRGRGVACAVPGADRNRRPRGECGVAFRRSLAATGSLDGGVDEFELSIPRRPEMIATLEQERGRMTERIQCLTRSRDAIADYLDEVRNNIRSGPAGE
jgi:hypothetical protein